ncbi:MAG: ribonuclease H-like domain-containing protein [Methanobrevibacter arboriphilus]|uniref:DNA polymerase n=1 Tax=Methanobrevibacter arboriphilus TaxID=39441 RepID=A0A843ANQ6_METAZ|nr:DNA-directed DNA polymerase [Methanobrevibacter arboriphilus]MBF4468440.1 ribonuclease H-like domain-containing protein [Methanobrevibacter arboriphilus]
MEIKNIILLDIDYITHEEKAVIRLFGKEKDENGKTGEKKIIALDDTFEPYIYVITNDIEKCIEDIEDLDFKLKKIEKVHKKKFQIEGEFLKVTFTHPQDVPKIREIIRDLESVDDIREHDIPFYRRYLIDNNIFPMSEIEVSGETIPSFPSIKSKDSNLKIMKLKKSPKTVDSEFPSLRILSFDLEVRNPDGMPNSKKDEIIMIGISSNFEVEKVISTKGKELDFVETVSSEEEMIKKFVEVVKNNNVDIIVGYNSDNFDFPYLKDRAGIYNINLDFGMDGSGVKFLRRGYANAASFKGLIHVDLYLVMRRYISLDRYTLERVYFELFGKEKIEVPGDRIYQFWDNGGEELTNLFNYSLDDVLSTLKIAEETLPLSLELTRIVGQPFFDLTRMATGQQAEWYLVRKAYEDNELVPNKPTGGEFSSRRSESAVGGYVKEPEKGLHDNLVQFDFRSLYPSIIISKNVSPDVLLKKHLGDDYNIANYLYKEEEIDEDENKFNISPEYDNKFAKTPKGFIPSVIGNVISERLKIKRQMRETDDPTEKRILKVQQDALKRLANTMYGIYGFSRFRWYSMECAESITAWGRDYIKETMKKSEEYGFKAIYADTDGFYAKYDR